MIRSNIIKLGLIIVIILIGVYIQQQCVVENFEQFYINLDRATDRRDHIEKNKLETNMTDVKRIAAFDGKNTELSDYEKTTLLRNLTTPYGWPASRLPGEKGCALSHYYLWKKIKKYRYPISVIFEDDVVFMKNSKKDIIYLTDNMQGYDIIFLYNTKYCNNTNDTKTIINLKETKGKWFGCGAMAYLITLNAAAYLVDKMNQGALNKHIDIWMYSNYNNLNIGVTKCSIVDKHAQFSKNSYIS